MPHKASKNNSSALDNVESNDILRTMSVTQHQITIHAAHTDITLEVKLHEMLKKMKLNNLCDERKRYPKSHAFFQRKLEVNENKL